MNQLICNESATNRSEEFYKRYRDGFGKIIKAEMKAEENKVEYVFTLTNDKDEIMIFNGGLTSGYIGGGSRATQRILEHAGFDATDEFIVENESFILEK